MKIQCDVCSKGEATVFCPADEAVLCDGCDNSIHHANKLAGKHTRFSLIHPSYKEFPLCDICQERRAFFFCKEDRAILCRECDLSIHKSNELTQKHNRFLLTGVKIHACTNSLHPTSSSSNGSEATIDAENRRPRATSNRSNTVSNEVFCSPSSGKTNLPAYKAVENQITDALSVGISSISEYLMETLPGWHVEDFLDPANIGFCKTYDHALPFEDQDLQRYTSFSPSEELAIWVPQFSPQFPVSLPQTDFLTGVEESAKRTNVKACSGKWVDDGFTVPQVSTPSLPFEDQDLQRYTSFSPSEDLAIWVPQFSPQFPVSLPQTDILTGVEESAKRTNVKACSRKWIDDGFTVPQVSPPSLKKSRHF